MMQFYAIVEEAKIGNRKNVIEYPSGEGAYRKEASVMYIEGDKLAPFVGKKIRVTIEAVEDDESD